MFKYCGNYRAFLTKTKFNTQNFLESQPDEFRGTVEKIVVSQMWNVFIYEREKFLKQGQIESMCMLAKHSKELWHSSDLSVSCEKCNISVTNHTHVVFGKLYCSSCYEIISAKDSRAYKKPFFFDIFIAKIKSFNSLTMYEFCKTKLDFEGVECSDYISKTSIYLHW